MGITEEDNGAVVADFLREASIEQLNTIIRNAIHRNIGKEEAENYDKHINVKTLNAYRDLLVRYYSGEYTEEGWHARIKRNLCMAGGAELADILAYVKEEMKL